MPELPLDGKLKTSYCIPLWLRDEQIRLALERKLPRIDPVKEVRTEPIAVVCFGPSLQDTWQKISEFKFVMSCSGSHKFLVDRHIIPTWHVEVDPRAHKVGLMGQPQHETTYLIASTCHPAVFDHLKEYSVQLWHVFDNDQEAQRILPTGEWAVFGGCDVGLRAMALARFFGFTQLHIFGKDGNEREGQKHASEHPKESPAESSFVMYNNKKYFTTTGFFEAARQTFHELDQMPDVVATFYGEGLVQDMAKNYVPQAAPKSVIALSKPELISEKYRELNAQLHRENLAFGVGGDRHVTAVLELAKTLGTKDILDYGCGKGRLARAIPWRIGEYDPAIPGKTESPKPADIVICTDVLEHIEPTKLSAVLKDLRRCVLGVGYFTIHTGPASKTLPNGENTHLIQKNPKWWGRTLTKFFSVDKMFIKGPELHVVVSPFKNKPKGAIPVSVIAANSKEAALNKP
jgi:uncharacterized Rossmann fold enzyme